MACTIWDTEVDWQRRGDLDMRKYPNFKDSTNHTIVILVKSVCYTDTKGFHTLDIVHRFDSIEAMNGAEN